MIPHVIRLSFWREDFSHLPFQQAEQRGKEAGIVILDFKDCLFYFYFSSIFFILFFTSIELGLGFPRRTREMDGSLQGVQERGLHPASEG